MSCLLGSRLIARSSRPIPLSHPRCFPSPQLSSRTYSTPSSSTPPNIRTTAFISVALLASALALYQYESTSTSTAEAKSSGPGAGETFSVNIRTSRGPQAHEFVRKSTSEVESILTEHESGEKQVGRRGNPVVRWDTNWVGSNEPCEDRFASNLIPRKQSAKDVKTSWLGSWTGPSASPEAGSESKGAKDLVLFSIIDGHAGDATSKLLEKTLHPTVAIALASLQAGYLPRSEGWRRVTEMISPSYWGLVKGGVWTPDNITRTLQHAFTQLDDQIVQTPVKLLPTLQGAQAPSGDASAALQTFVTLSEPADHGACAITALVDAENEDLYVALVGDCRAVAGWQGADGRWRCDTLTEDQMGENPREIERMRSEHPASERDTVIKGGRVQGGLQPTRAFGDATYKWTLPQATAIAEAFKQGGVKPRSVRPWYYTPPYVTANPVVTYRKLHNEDGEKLKFVVMATDGLWDRLTSEEATLLVASYLAHPKHNDIAKTVLPKMLPLAETKGERPYPAQDLPQPTDSSWSFEGDSNAATHLIRNSLAGANRKNRAELLSMTGEVTRWMRDDITVTVVFFDDKEQGKQ
ncbi:hypothetical protein IAU60_000168 [Kwoniella sp. DSM 27419]